MPQTKATDMNFKIPRILRENDVDKGEKRLREVMNMIAPIQAEINRAQHELMIVQVIKAVKGLEGLESIAISASPESDDEGGSSVYLNVECYLAGEEDDYDEDASEELSELLCNATDEIYRSDLNESNNKPKAFISALAVALLGKKESKAWFAEREAAEIGDSARKTKRSVKTKSL